MAGAGDHASQIVPHRALVVPRVQTSENSAALPLEHHIRRMLDSGTEWIVNVFGRCGSGKTTAMQHLADAFRDEPRLILLDRNEGNTPTETPPRSVTVFTSFWQIEQSPRVTRLRMARWTNDDCIEYLAAVHRGRLQGVMMRVTASVDQAELDGSPELWRIALDLLSAEESIETVGAALKWLIGMEFPAGHLRENAGCFSVAALTSSAPKETEDIFRRFDLRARRLLCHRSIRYVLAAEALVNGMIGDGSAAMFTKMLPIDLLRYAAAVGRTQPGFADALIPVTRYGAFQAQINAANILHAMKIGWKPDGRHTAQLTDAHLEEALWPEVKLARCWGDRTHFERADLKRADFERSSLRHAYFNSACLRGAILREADASQADFTDADLSLVSARRANFVGATLRHAKLRNADFAASVFTSADLRDARLSEGEFTGAIFRFAKLEGADFSGATLNCTHLVRLDLRLVELESASFRKADLSDSNLEGCDLSNCNFLSANLSKALLTGTIATSASFRNATLIQAGLADVQWELADLRGADFTGASFHAGSTRSGLVGSLTPGEGSKTGFYTDDFGDREYKPIEEIRKANLRGAELRGAKIDGVDFYLVDVRDARFTRRQAKWLKRCGAIMCP